MAGPLSEVMEGARFLVEYHGEGRVAWETRELFASVSPSLWGHRGKKDVWEREAKSWMERGMSEGNLRTVAEEIMMKIVQLFTGRRDKREMQMRRALDLIKNSLLDY